MKIQPTLNLPDQNEVASPPPLPAPPPRPFPLLLRRLDTGWDDVAVKILYKEVSKVLADATCVKFGQIRMVNLWLSNTLMLILSTAKNFVSLAFVV